MQAAPLLRITPRHLANKAAKTDRVLRAACPILHHAIGQHGEIFLPTTDLPRLLSAALISLLLGTSAMAAPITLALGGDLIGPYAPQDGAPTSGFGDVADLFAGADIGIANFEGASFDLATHTGPASAETGGGYPVIPPANTALLARIGIRLVSKANNHATDWGYQGLAETLATLRAQGIAYAGAGPTLDQASAPAYVDTPAGKVALISVASTFTPMSVAGPSVPRGGRMFDRPGINALHVHEVRLVRPATMAALRRAAGPVQSPAGPHETRIGDQIFRTAPREGTVWEADSADVARLMAAIRTARTHARIVVLAIHAHETAGHDDDLPPAAFEPLLLHRANEAPSPDDPRPAGFLQPLFHQAIEAGADVVMRTGPHQVGGIEVWHGKPIFYSLGSLAFSFGGRHSYTAPGGQTKTLPQSWFETVVPVLRIDGARVQISLHPAVIHSSKDALDGLPETPSPARGAAILERVQRLSETYGTRMKAGVITLP
jgi:poly-gamma-glutamate synthesis protein (capsule biosynthesis protein)